MGIKLDLYNSIVTTIQAIVTATVPDINHVGLWNNQLDNENQETAFNYPAVFIEFAAIPWERTNQQPIRSGDNASNVSKEQKAPNTLITLHCCFSQLDDVDISFPIIEPTIEKIYFAIQGLEVNCATALLRGAERQDVDHDRVIDWQMDFSTSLFQIGEVDATQELIAADALTVEVNRTDIQIEPGNENDIRTDIPVID